MTKEASDRTRFEPCSVLTEAICLPSSATHARTRHHPAQFSNLEWDEPLILNSIENLVQHPSNLNYVKVPQRAEQCMHTVYRIVSDVPHLYSVPGTRIPGDHPDLPGSSQTSHGRASLDNFPPFHVCEGARVRPRSLDDASLPLAPPSTRVHKSTGIIVKPSALPHPVHKSIGIASLCTVNVTS